MSMLDDLIARVEVKFNEKHKEILTRLDRIEGKINAIETKLQGKVP